MNTATILTSFALLSAGGCATIQMYRHLSVEIVRIQPQLKTSNGLTSTSAVDLFRRVASELKFKVEGPVQLSATEIAYTADAVGKNQANISSLMIRINDKRILFSSSVYGTERDFSVARDSAGLYERALDERGIQYVVHEGVTVPPP